jgi:putative ABC transport system permease protein
MDGLSQDVRYALRSLLRTPGFTFVAVLALALGIGANTAIFTVVDAVLLERLPFGDPGRIVALWETNARRPGRSNVVGPANFIRWGERAKSFEALAAFADSRVNLTGSGDPEELVSQNVTEQFFAVLDVAPLLGRTFTPEESRNPDRTAVVLSYDLWQRRFASDPSLVGRTITINMAPRTVVGIMPPGVRLFMKTGALVGKPAELWMPYPLPPEAREPRGRYLSAVARLAPGVSVDEARAEMNPIAASLSAELPDFDTGWGAQVVPLHRELSGDLRPALLVLSGAIGFVLLIACANVANLLLARGAVRRREMAIRAALGAARARIVRQLFTESLVLGVIGGLAGLLVAQWSLALLLAMSPIDPALVGQIGLSYPVLAFTAAVSIATAILCGFAPAWEGSRADVQDTLKDGARQGGTGVRHRQLRHAFVIAEVALAVVLLVGAGLMLRTFDALRHAGTGFDATNVLTMRTYLPSAKYQKSADVLRFYRDLTARTAEMPGVQAAGIVSYLPLAGLGAGTDFTIEGQPPPARGHDLSTDVTVCDNGYFQALHVHLTRGRFFTERELTEKNDVVIVNEALVRQYLPHTDPIGQRLTIDMVDKNVPTRIVGVVADTKFVDMATPPHPTSYWPHPQLPYNAMTLTVRTASDPRSFIAPVEMEIHRLDKDQPVSDIRTMDQWVARALAQSRFTSTVLAIFAVLALLLAEIGIYGVMSYAVSQRTSEIGIRIALGAGRQTILGMIVGDGIRLAAIGLGIGVALALALNRAITSLLFGTTATDPITFAAVVGLLAVVAVLASYVPARRAARIAPSDALRAS